MTYYLSRIVALPFDNAIAEVIDGLRSAGFGILTDIDVQATLRSKIGADMGRYRILGACNPHLAHEALQIESHLGVMLPCNVIVRETAEGQVEVASVDPVAAMQRTGNPALVKPALEVRKRLSSVLDSIRSPAAAP